MVGTGIRNSELANIALGDVNLNEYTIRIAQGKGKKDRYVPFPALFLGELTQYMENQKARRAKYLFETNRQEKFSTPWIREIVKKYARQAGIDKRIYPHLFRHQLLTYLARKGIIRGEASYGYCASKGEKYYGFEGHLLISLSGVITRFTITDAATDEREALWELLAGVHGLVIGDKGYISESLRQELLSYGIELQTPLRSNMHDERDSKWVAMLTSVRRLVETVIGQLSERFHIEKVRARDLWHLTSRIARKLLAHTVGVYLNHLLGRELLQFDVLLEA